jgi:hypothetical protein
MKNHNKTAIHKLLIKLLICCIITFFFNNSAYGGQVSTDIGNNKQSVSKGYKITGICLSTLGGACIVASIPLFASAMHMANEKSMIDSNIRSTFGSCLAIGGLVFGGISIPFYIKNKKLSNGSDLSFNFSSNNLNMVYEF